MFIYSYDCVCESLSMLLDMRSRSENRYGSGVFVLSTSFIYFYFVTGLRAMMGKISATGSERGNGFDLSLFMISERICHSMESRTFHIYIGIQQKIPGKESNQPLCTACAMASAWSTQNHLLLISFINTFLSDILWPTTYSKSGSDSWSRGPRLSFRIKVFLSKVSLLLCFSVSMDDATWLGSLF